MIDYEPKAWFTLIFRWYGSVVPGIFIELILTLGLGFLAYWLDSQRIRMRDLVAFIDDPDEEIDGQMEIVDDKVHSLLIIPLGFLLIFRSNNAYARYWEGRATVGAMVRSCRDMMRVIASYCEGDDEVSQIERAELRRLINMIFALARQHLELPPSRRDLTVATMSMVTPNEAKVLKRVRNRVSIAGQWFSFRVNESVRAGRLSKMDVRLIEEHLSSLLAAWQAADKIVHTPLPYPYVQMLNILLVLFVFSAPFTFANRFGGFTPIMALLVAFALLGINAVAAEIENPFGQDANDLPLERFAAAVEEDTEIILRQRDPDTEKYEKFWGKRALHQRLLRDQQEQIAEADAAEGEALPGRFSRVGSRGFSLAGMASGQSGSARKRSSVSMRPRGSAPKVGAASAPQRPGGSPGGCAVAGCGANGVGGGPCQEAGPVMARATACAPQPPCSAGAPGRQGR